MNVIQTNFKFNVPLSPLDLKEVQYIVVHHAAATIASPEDVHAWHLKRGWSGFGYNEMIRKNGDVYIGRGLNVGAHCKGRNSVSIGILCEGDYDNIDKVMPEEQYESLLERIRYYKSIFPNKVQLMPHKTFVETVCPGRYFPMAAIISDLVKPPYKDIKNHYAEESIVKAYNYGLMIGRGNGVFDPDACLTRAELAAVAVNIFEKLKS